MNDDVQTDAIDVQDDPPEKNSTKARYIRAAIACLVLYLTALWHFKYCMYQRIFADTFLEEFLNRIFPVMILVFLTAPFVGSICLLLALKLRASKALVFPLLFIAFLCCCLTTAMILLPSVSRYLGS